MKEGRFFFSISPFTVPLSLFCEGKHIFHWPWSSLKILIILSLNLCFESEVWWNGEIWKWVEEIHAQYVCLPFLVVFFLIVFIVPWALVDPRCLGIQQDSRQLQGKCVTGQLSKWGPLMTLGGHSFHLNQNLLHKKKEGDKGTF